MRPSRAFPILSLVLLGACTAGVDIDAEKERVASVLEQHIHANETQNLDLYLSSWAPDEAMVNLGMSGERWIGREDLRAHAIEIWGLVENSQFTIKDLVINMDEAGRVAWFSCSLDIAGEMLGAPVTIDGMRFTGVLQKREQDWVYVQTHASQVPPAEGTEG